MRIARGARAIRADDPTIDPPRDPTADPAYRGVEAVGRFDMLRLVSYLRKAQERARMAEAGADLVATSEALDSTMEELRVAIRKLHHFEAALDNSRAELDAERRRYRDLFELSPDAYLVTDLQGTVREANLAALELLNIPARFILKKSLFGFFDGADRPASRLAAARFREAIGPVEYDLRIRPRRRPPLDGSIRIGVERDALGQAIALRWTIRDVSARKRAEQEIKGLNEQLEGLAAERSEQVGSALEADERRLIKAHADVGGPEGRFFRDIVEEVDAILWRADAATGRYTFISRRAEELLGHPASRWLGEPGFWLEVIHPEDRGFVEAHRRKQLGQGAAHESEYRVIAADGRFLWFREAVRPIQAGPDGPASVYGLMVNICRRKKVERQLYTAKGELASRLRDLEFLHELSGRLVAARGLAEVAGEAVGAVASLLGADLAMLWLIEPGRGGAASRSTLTAEVGLPEAFARRSGLAGFAPAMVSSVPLGIEDVGLEPEGSVWRQVGELAGFRAVIVVPLAARDGGPLGSVVAGFAASGRLGGRQTAFVEMYAVRASAAIEAALDLERLERSDRREAGALLDAEAALALALAALEADPAQARRVIEAQARKIRRIIDAE